MSNVKLQMQEGVENIDIIRNGTRVSYQRIDPLALSRLISDILVNIFDQDADAFILNRVTVRTDFMINNRRHSVFFGVIRNLFDNETAAKFYICNRIVKQVNRYIYKKVFIKQFRTVKRMKHGVRKRFRKGALAGRKTSRRLGY